MASESEQLRQLASLLRKEAAAYEQNKDQKVAALLQAGQALNILKEKLNVR